jgi:HAMP domain-containing protein
VGNGDLSGIAVALVIITIMLAISTTQIIRRLDRIASEIEKGRGAMETTALFRLLRAIDKQLGQVPEWKVLIAQARSELGAIERKKEEMR